MCTHIENFCLPSRFQKDDCFTRREISHLAMGVWIWPSLLIFISIRHKLSDSKPARWVQIAGVLCCGMDRRSIAHQIYVTVKQGEVNISTTTAIDSQRVYSFPFECVRHRLLTQFKDALIIGILLIGYRKYIWVALPQLHIADSQTLVYDTWLLCWTRCL